MICPHCGKAIQFHVSAKAIERARHLRDEGFSLRDIEKKLHAEGLRVSISTLSRALRQDLPPGAAGSGEVLG
jgi:hypothetical protein